MGLLTTMSTIATTTIEPQAIADLRALNPDEPGFLRELIELFIQDVPGRFAEIERALATQDAPLLTRAAHSIKGSCSNFGATDLQRLSQQMENQGKSAAFAEATAALPGLRAEFDLVAEALKQFC